MNTNTYQPFVPGINYCIEHGFIEETITHPLWYDDVYSLYRQLNLFHLSFDNGHNWGQRKSVILFTFQSSCAPPHSFIHSFTYHPPACWLSQFSQHSLKCCCILSVKTKPRTFECTSICAASQKKQLQKVKLNYYYSKHNVKLIQNVDID